PNLAENQTFIRMFLDEARLSLHLTHANIVQVFDIGRAGDTYFIVMEFVDGTNLKSMTEAMQRQGIRLQAEHAVYIMVEVCKGLAHAHQKRDPQGKHLGIVHRDVSPPNIMLSTEGEVKLTDFGLAKAAIQVELTDPGVVKGKFGYLSPEAAHGQAVDQQTDIFACGILLWELLAGQRLFQGKTDMETLELVRKCKVPSLTKLNPNVPPALDDIVQRSLAKNKAKRYQSAQDLGRDLSQYLFSASQHVTAYDVSGVVRQVLRYDRLRKEQKPKENQLNNLVQQEIDRIIGVEADALDLGEDDLMVDFTGAQPAVSTNQMTSPKAGPSEQSGLSEGFENPLMWEGFEELANEIDLESIATASGQSFPRELPDGGGRQDSGMSPWPETRHTPPPSSNSTGLAQKPAGQAAPPAIPTPPTRSELPREVIDTGEREAAVDIFAKVDNEPEEQAGGEVAKTEKSGPPVKLIAAIAAGVIVVLVGVLLALVLGK
ncbi:MAG: serine/threonine protein kinase, partial [Myxococcales bacterium]|nr:serine/threonine protein kinase [Myxococcales bacterium]